MTTPFSQLTLIEMCHSHIETDFSEGRSIRILCELSGRQLTENSMVLEDLEELPPICNYEVLAKVQTRLIHENEELEDYLAWARDQLPYINRKTGVTMTKEQQKLIHTLVIIWAQLKLEEKLTNEDIAEMIQEFPVRDEESGDEFTKFGGLFPEPCEEVYAVEHLLRMLEVRE